MDKTCEYVKPVVANGDERLRHILESCKTLLGFGPVLSMVREKLFVDATQQTWREFCAKEQGQETHFPGIGIHVHLLRIARFVTRRVVMKPLTMLRR